MRLILSNGSSTHLSWMIMRGKPGFPPVNKTFVDPPDLYQLLRVSPGVPTAYWITMNKTVQPPKSTEIKLNNKGKSTGVNKSAIPRSNKLLTIYLQFRLTTHKIPEPWLKLCEEFESDYRVILHKPPNEDWACRYLIDELGYRRYEAGTIVSRALIKEGDTDLVDYLYLDNLTKANPKGTPASTILTYGLTTGTAKVDFYQLLKNLGSRGSLSMISSINSNESVALFAYLTKALQNRQDGVFYYLAICRKAADDTKISYHGAITLFVKWYYLYKNNHFIDLVEATSWIHKVLGLQG